MCMGQKECSKGGLDRGSQCVACLMSTQNESVL